MKWDNRPTTAQQRFLEWEMGAFFHFGIRTFYEGHRDWDGLPMPAEAFRPDALDCGQWIRAVKAAGCRYAVLVCKHHDGFANWPSAQSDYGVAQTPWRNGRGDVVREFTEACRREGLAVGLYYSPAQFGSVQADEAAYNDYFIAQITELLTNYGRIDYLWFDACGSGDFCYDTEKIVSVIRSLQPEILIFNLWDPDTRWVGNESGVAGLGNRSFVENFDLSLDAKQPQRLERPAFLPAECDTCIRGHDWFYSEKNEASLKSVEELLGLYEHSVGRGANFLLNIGPDRRGLLPDVDVERLRAFGEARKRRYKDARVPGLRQEVSRDERGRMLLRLEWDAPRLVSRAILREDLTQGERVRAFSLRAWPEDKCPPVEVYIGRGIGHKHIASFPPIRTRRMEVVIDASDGEPVWGAAEVLEAE